MESDTPELDALLAEIDRRPPESGGRFQDWDDTGGPIRLEDIASLPDAREITRRRIAQLREEGRLPVWLRDDE